MASASVMDNESGVKICICARESTTSASRPIATITPHRVFMQPSSNRNKRKKMPAEVTVCSCKKSSSGRHVAVKLDKNVKQYIELNFRRALSKKMPELEQNVDLLRSSSDQVTAHIKDIFDNNSMINDHLKYIKFSI